MGDRWAAKKICVICNICEIPARIGQRSVEFREIGGTNKQQRRISASSAKFAWLNSSPNRASRKEDSERLSPVFKSPEEMPCPEDRLTQSLSRIISHEVHIPPYLQEILLSHSLLCKMPVLGEVPSEVATIQYLCQQQLSSLLIHRSYHLFLW